MQTTQLGNERRLRDSPEEQARTKVARGRKEELCFREYCPVYKNEKQLGQAQHDLRRKPAMAPGASGIAGTHQHFTLLGR